MTFPVRIKPPILILAGALCLSACTASNELGSPAMLGFILPTAQHQKDSDLLYHLMTGQLYYRKGDAGDSLEHYALAAEISDDAKVVGIAFMRAAEQGNFVLSYRLANKYLRLGGKELAYREMLAVVYTVADDIDAVERQVRSIPEVERKKGFFFSRLAELLVKVKSAREATQTLASVVSRFPDAVDAQSALAVLALKSQEYDVARQAAENVIQLSPEDHQHYFIKARSLILQGNPQEGLAIVRAHAHAPESRKHYLTRLNFVKLLFENNEVTQAQEELEDMLTIWPLNPEILDKLAISNYRFEVIGAAEKYFSRLTEYLAFVDKAHYYLGQIALQRGNYQAATDHFREVHPGQYFRIAQSAVIETLKKQQKADSLPEYFEGERALQSDAFAKATLYLLETNELLVDERREESYLLLQKATKEIPNSVDLLYFQGIVAAELGMKAAAKNDFSLVVKLEPNHYDALNALGYMYADDNERLPEAKSLVERAYQLKMDSSEILDSMGWVLFRLQNFEQAEHFMRLSLALTRNPIVVGHLVEILLAMGSEDEAREELSHGLAEFPDDAYLRSLVTPLPRSTLKDGEVETLYF